MTPPGWLPDLFAWMMLAIVAYAGWRLTVARVWGRRTEVAADVTHAAIALAVAGLLVPWMTTLPRGGWTAVFAVATLWFAGRAALDWHRGDVRGSMHRHAADALGAAVVVYMFVAGLAPSTVRGSTVGEYTMAGMPGMVKDNTIAAPALGFAIAAALTVYAVVVLDRVGALSPTATTGQAGGELMLAPRSVECCRVVLCLTMAYAILARLV